MDGDGKDLVGKPLDQLAGAVLVVPQAHALVGRARGQQRLADANVQACAAPRTHARTHARHAQRRCLPRPAFRAGSAGRSATPAAAALLRPVERSPSAVPSARCIVQAQCKPAVPRRRTGDGPLVVVGAQHVKVHLVRLHDLVVAQQQGVELPVLQRANQVLLVRADGQVPASTRTATATTQSCEHLARPATFPTAGDAPGQGGLDRRRPGSTLTQALSPGAGAPDGHGVVLDGEGARAPVVFLLVLFKDGDDAAVLPRHKALAVAGDGLHLQPVLSAEGALEVRAVLRPRNSNNNNTRDVTRRNRTPTVGARSAEHARLRWDARRRLRRRQPPPPPAAARDWGRCCCWPLLPPAPPAGACTHPPTRSPAVPPAPSSSQPRKPWPNARTSSSSTSPSSVPASSLSLSSVPSLGTQHCVTMEAGSRLPSVGLMALSVPSRYLNTLKMAWPTMPIMLPSPGEKEHCGCKGGRQGANVVGARGARPGACVRRAGRPDCRAAA